jgi:transglutaminase-like putative cysteine protease
MHFRIVHHTEYRYQEPASDSFIELRVWPRDSESQRVLQRDLSIEPTVDCDHYLDYFGNRVEYFSIPFRHERLSVKAWADVETFSAPPPAPCLEVTVGEARQIMRGMMIRLFDFLQPTYHVPLEPEAAHFIKRPFPEKQPLGEALIALNHHLHNALRYRPGVTSVGTPLREIMRRKRGVCQDFAHLMLAILRLNGLPARYVSGYIESDVPDGSRGDHLTGGAASHAWVEVWLPGGWWWGLDPTNDQTAGERHVRVAVGRDYRDVSPLRGAFKGARDHRLHVNVSVRRRRQPRPGRKKQPAL